MKNKKIIYFKIKYKKSNKLSLKKVKKIINLIKFVNSFKIKILIY